MVGRNKDPVVVDLHFESCVPRRTLGKLVCGVVKYVAYQRAQIPCQFELLQKIVESANRGGDCLQGPSTDPESLEGSEKEIKAHIKAVRQRLKEERVRQQDTRKHLRYVKKAEKAIQLLQSVLQPIEDAFNHPMAPTITRVAIVLGPTPMNPKEVYHMNIPETLPEIEESDGLPLKRVLFHTFRNLVMADQLQNVMKPNVGLTNLRVYIQGGHCSDKFIPKPDYDIPATRGQHVHFNVAHERQQTRTSLAPFPDVTPILGKRRRLDVGHFFQTPANRTQFESDMSLCTPVTHPAHHFCEDVLSEDNMDDLCMSIDELLSDHSPDILQSTPFKTESKPGSSMTWFQVPAVFKGFKA